jgi:signal transduction histidine kinase
VRLGRTLLPAGRPVPVEEWAGRHARLVVVVWVHVPVLFVFALSRGRGGLGGLAAALPVAGCALLASWPALGRQARTALVPVGLLTSSALLVHLADGATEMHFHYFVAIALLALYGEWMPFLLALGLIIAYHTVFGLLLPAELSPRPETEADPWPWIAINTMFTLAAGGASLSAWRINERSRARAEADLKRAYELEREAVDKLRELDMAKNTFVSTMSHELRTPLTTILGYLELLGDEPEQLGELGAQAVEVMDRNARRLRAMVEDLLVVSGVESRQSPAQFSDIEPAELLEQVKADVEAKAAAAELELAVRAEDGLGLVNGESEQLRRALGKLAENAVKFTAPGGRVELRASQDVGAVRLEVADTGIGIPLGEQDQLFTRFFRSSLARERQTPGAGLGLAIVKRIVDLHGGEIALTSTPGQGTTASIVLPARVPATAEDQVAGATRTLAAAPGRGRPSTSTQVP